jgi:hypothetical protein
VLADDSSARKGSVLLLLLVGQLVPSWLLLRGVTIVMQFLYALIAFVGYTLYCCIYSYLAPLEEFELVLSSLADRDTDYLTGLVFYDEL